jgi:hypothetical protein
MQTGVMGEEEEEWRKREKTFEVEAKGLQLPMHNCERNNKGCHKCAHRVIFNPQINVPCSFLQHPMRRGGGGGAEGTRGEASVRCGAAPA